MMFHGHTYGVEPLALSRAGMGDDSGVSVDTSTMDNLPLPPSGVTTGVTDTSGSGTSWFDFGSGASGGSAGSNPSGNASTGFNWGGLFTTALNDATKVASQFFAGQNQQAQTQAQLQAQQNQLKYGTTVSASVGSSNLTPLLLIGGGALALVLVMKGRK